MPDRRPRVGVRVTIIPVRDNCPSGDKVEDDIPQPWKSVRWMSSSSLGQSENGNITSRQGLPSFGLLMPARADLVGRVSAGPDFDF